MFIEHFGLFDSQKKKKGRNQNSLMMSIDAINKQHLEFTSVEIEYCITFLHTFSSFIITAGLLFWRDTFYQWFSAIFIILLELNSHSKPAEVQRSHCLQVQVSRSFLKLTLRSSDTRSCRFLLNSPEYPIGFLLGFGGKGWGWRQTQAHLRRKLTY